MTTTLIDALQKRQSDTVAAARALLTTVTAENREMTDLERFEHTQRMDEAEQIKTRIAELQAEETRANAANASRLQLGDVGPQTGGAHVTDPVVYARDNRDASFFKDLLAARSGDGSAIQRLARNNQERALSTTAGAGGEFAPPLWLVDEFIALARPGRVTANLLHKEALPSGVSSINLPKVATGTSTAVQATQNAAVSQTDLTTTSVSSGVTTISGKQVISLQLLEQSGIPFDQVILADLAADYAVQLDTQVISGTGASGQLHGLLGVSGATAITYTQTTPSVVGAGGFYPTVTKAIATVGRARKLPPTHIVMTPERWAWVAGAFDGNNRPLVSPSGDAFNQVAAAGPVGSEGLVGQMAGLPVYTDLNLPTNLGTGTNQDPVLILRADDAWLWESDLRAEMFTQPYADSMGILARVYAYSAAIPNRYPAGIGIVLGTGLVTPA